MTNRLRDLSGCLLFCIAVACAGSARANSGTQIPLSQIQAGSEQTSPNVVLNPSFEAVTGTVPNNWLQNGNMRVSAPINPPPNNPSAIGNLSAQALTNQPVASDPENYHYTTDGATQAVLMFDQSKDYVLSAYVWNFARPDPNPGVDTPDLALVELDDPTVVGSNKNVSLARNGTDGGDAANGYFIYQQFHGNFFPNGALLDVRGDLQDQDPRPINDLYAQFDNIAITPADQFVGPTIVPEPASLAMIVLTGILLRRRK